MPDTTPTAVAAPMVEPKEAETAVRQVISDDDMESLTSPLSIQDPPNDDLKYCTNVACFKPMWHRGACELPIRPL